MDGAKLVESIRRLFASEDGEVGEGAQFEIQRSSEEWRSSLRPDQFRVLREHGTARNGQAPVRF